MCGVPTPLHGGLWCKKSMAISGWQWTETASHIWRMPARKKRSSRLGLAQIELFNPAACSARPTPESTSGVAVATGPRASGRRWLQRRPRPTATSTQVRVRVHHLQPCREDAIDEQGFELRAATARNACRHLVSWACTPPESVETTCSFACSSASATTSSLTSRISWK